VADSRSLIEAAVFERSQVLISMLLDKLRNTIPNTYLEETEIQDKISELQIINNYLLGNKP
jgi:hypothetical protein